MPLGEVHPRGLSYSATTPLGEACPPGYLTRASISCVRHTPECCLTQLRRYLVTSSPCWMAPPSPTRDHVSRPAPYTAARRSCLRVGRLLHHRLGTTSPCRLPVPLPGGFVPVLAGFSVVDWGPCLQAGFLCLRQATLSPRWLPLFPPTGFFASTVIWLRCR